MTEDSREDPVGGVVEEAAKLLGALQDWAREGSGAYGAAAASAADDAASALGAVNQHLATGGAECRYCPLCRAIARLRETSPEVRTHLVAAASSLLQAAAGALATEVPDQARRRREDVEKIDLSDGVDDGIEWEGD